MNIETYSAIQTIKYELKVNVRDRLQKLLNGDASIGGCRGGVPAFCYFANLLYFLKSCHKTVHNMLSNLFRPCDLYILERRTLLEIWCCGYV